MHIVVSEAVGTGLLMIFGSGVVSNALLSGTKGHNVGSNWMVITMGWSMGVFVGVFTSAQFSGGHINPAVTFALLGAGKLEAALVPQYLIGQLIGAFIGASLVWVHYKDHFARTENKDIKLAVFCTAPEIRNTASNFFSEVLGTFVLVVAVLLLAEPEVGLGALDALPVALVVLGIGLALGGTTGYAINPARDLAPRFAHFVLPIPNKRDSDWGYSWIPVVGPILGGLLAAGFFLIAM